MLDYAAQLRLCSTLSIHVHSFVGFCWFFFSWRKTSKSKVYVWPMFGLAKCKRTSEQDRNRVGAHTHNGLKLKRNSKVIRILIFTYNSIQSRTKPYPNKYILYQKMAKVFHTVTFYLCFFSFLLLFLDSFFFLFISFRLATFFSANWMCSLCFFSCVSICNDGFVMVAHVWVCVCVCVHGQTHSAINICAAFLQRRARCSWYRYGWWH